MTREEAATILYNEWQGFLEDNLDYAGISDAYKMAINTLKQEPTLDKIRAEITDWQTDIHDNECDAETHDFVFERIYEIIDEYKVESEDKV